MRSYFNIEIGDEIFEIHEEYWVDTMGECENKYKLCKKLYGDAIASIIVPENWKSKNYPIAPRFVVLGFTIK